VTEPASPVAMARANGPDARSERTSPRELRVERALLNGCA
jgi:hypothetical protein